MWRAMESLLVLRDQANAIAPDRSTASDGLVGDEAHQGTNSDHNPHAVPGVGDNIVTALDLTHDPAHGFDSYAFAETLRRNRDRRNKYVISNRRIFSSYAVSGYAAYTWRPYNGVDPHTGHVHISVLDAPISDTRTPWNLEGFDMTVTDVLNGEYQTWLNAAARTAPPGQPDYWGRQVSDAMQKIISGAVADEFKAVMDKLAEYAALLVTISERLDAIEAGGGGPLTVTSTVTSVVASGEPT